MKDISQLPVKSMGKSLHLTLRSLARTLLANFAKESVNLTVDQYIVMKVVNFDTDINQTQLAKHMIRDKSSLFRQINLLQERRLIARIQDPEDKRRNFLVITKQGAELLEIAMKIEDQTVKQLLQDVSKEEFEVFESVMKKIQNNGNKHIG